MSRHKESESYFKKQGDRIQPATGELAVKKRKRKMGRETDNIHEYFPQLILKCAARKAIKEKNKRERMSHIRFLNVFFGRQFMQSKSL